MTALPLLHCDPGTIPKPETNRLWLNSWHAPMEHNVDAVQVKLLRLFGLLAEPEHELSEVLRTGDARVPPNLRIHHCRRQRGTADGLGRDAAASSHTKLTYNIIRILGEECKNKTGTQS